MAIYLIRHGAAGDRSAWNGADSERPLSKKGRRQADALVLALGDEAIGLIFSSPATRCEQTVEPLAGKLGLAIEVTRVFEEGADADDALALLRSRANENPMASTHGDVIPKIIRRVVRSGVKLRDADLCQKGSVWIFDTNGSEIVGGRYVPPESDTP